MASLQRRRFAAPFLGLVAALAFAAPALGAPDAAALCEAMKLRAAGKEARDRLLCEKRGLATGADPTCVADAQERRAIAFARAEKRGGCAIEDDSAAIGNEVITLGILALELARPYGPEASRCSAAQLSAMAHALRRITRAHARNIRKPDPERLAADLAAAESRFATSFDRALAKGDCLSSTGFDVFSFRANSVVARFRGQLRPACGDNVTAQGEQCDGYDAFFCSDGCVESCTCAPATCPCWTTESLDALFPPGHFDQNGRGGAVCSTSPALGASVASQDTCFLSLPPAVGGSGNIPRSGAAMLSNLCVLMGIDLDDGNDGLCSGPPWLQSVKEDQAAVCNAELMATAAFQQCPAP